MSRLVMLAVMVAGCSYTSPTDPGDDTPGPDGGDQCVSFSTFVETCALPPGGSLELMGANTFDTNTGELFAGAMPINVDTRTLTTASGEVKALLVSAVVFAPDATLRAIGARPFAIIASDSIALDTNARIDVSGGGAGAGASCPNPSGRGTDRNGGAGGGGGGGFAGAGGTGGAGDTDDGATPAPGGVGGMTIAFPESVLGGCAGANGGNDDNDVGGDGGAGGGGVMLVAGRRIDIADSAGIDAGGEGGRGGEQHSVFSGDAGGGGGGSGGMIVLEAPSVICAGTLAANGGGGGEGSGNSSSGDNGERGNFGLARASGGSGGSQTGTDGGLGGAKLDVIGASVGAPQPGGGGGGGGGAGFVHIVAPAQDLSAATVSPNPS